MHSEKSQNQDVCVLNLSHCLSRTLNGENFSCVSLAWALGACWEKNYKPHYFPNFDTSLRGRCTNNIWVLITCSFLELLFDIRSGHQFPEQNLCAMAVTTFPNIWIKKLDKVVWRKHQGEKKEGPQSRAKTRIGVGDWDFASRICNTHYYKKFRFCTKEIQNQILLPK